MQFDCIINGAGPAGCTAALALAGKGLNIAVIEKSNFPRDKVCGGALAAYIPKVLNTINPEFREAFYAFPDKIPAHTCRIFSPERHFIDFNVGQTGYLSTRESFDTFLYDLASTQPGIHFFLNHKTKRIDIHPVEDAVTVTTDQAVFESRILIGCDGANGLSAKTLSDSSLNRNHSCVAVRALYENVSGFEEGTFELHLLKEALPGYFWMFPLPGNRANIGLGMLSAEIAESGRNLRQDLFRCIESNPAIAERLKNATRITAAEAALLPLGSRKVRISGKNFMLCGDAASLINPLTGEGIGQAMVSGRYAGWQALDCIEKNDFSAKRMQQYDRQVYAKFLKINQKSYFIQRFLMKRTSLLNSIIRHASRHEPLRRFIVKIAT